MRVGGKHDNSGYRVGRSRLNKREELAATAVATGSEAASGLIAHDFLGEFHSMPLAIGRSDFPQVTDGAGTVEFRSSGFYSLLDFGATGDGVTEDTAAVQSALDTAASNSKALYVPPGFVFRCRKLKLPSNTVLYGVPGKSKLLLLGDTADGQDTRYGMILDGATGAKSNITIRDLVIYGLNEDTAVSNNVCNIPIVMTGAVEHTDLSIERCEFYYFRSRVLFQDNLGTTLRLRFVDNLIRDIGTVTMNLHVPGSPPPTTGPTDVTVAAITPGTTTDAFVSGNRIRNIGTAANHWAIYGSRNTKYLTITHNHIHNCIGGIKLQNANHEFAIISSNQLRSISARQGIILGGGPGPMICDGNSIQFSAGNTSSAIQIVSSSSVSCNGNTVDLGGNSADGGVFNINDAQNVTLSGNTAENGNTAAGGGVLIFSDTGETTENILLVGNAFRDVASIGFFVTDSAGTLRNCSYIGNTIKAPRGMVIRDGEDFMVLGNHFEATGKTVEMDVANMNRLVCRGNRGSGTGIWYSGTNHIIEDNALEAQPQPSLTDTGSKVRRNALPATAAWVSITTGTTPSVLTSDRFLLAHTGATTVTNFTDGRDGEVKQFLATTANVTLQHGAGVMLLRDGANFAMAIGDAITLWRNGTVWQEASRKQAENHNLFSSRHPDVDATDTPADGEVLTYDSSSSKWKSSPAAAAGGALLGSWGENDIDVAWTTAYAELKRLDHPTFFAISKIMPKAGSITAFAVQTSVVLPIGSSITLEAYKNGVAQAGTVTMINGSSSGYNTTGFSFVAGDLLTIKGKLDTGTPTAGTDVDAQLYGKLN